MTLHPDFVTELRKQFMGEIRLDATSKILYSTDASIYQVEPLGVAIPKTQDDLQSAVELAVKYKVPILPRGSGSSLAGQAIGHALILDCSRWLDAIVEIDPESRTATVEPGVVLSTLNAASARYGLMFGPDPASAERATMGGVIGNNATGAHSILYGMSADNILSADVILGDGTAETWVGNKNSKLTSTIQNIRRNYAESIKQNYPKTWRNSAGYRLNYLLPWSPSAPPQWVGEYYPANLKPDNWSLAPLLAGSEGTLAVMRCVTVNLVPKPNHTVLGVLSYRSISEACDDVPRLLEFHPSAIELIPQMILRLARNVPVYARQMGWVIGDPAAVLIVEFSGDQPSAMRDAIRRIGDVVAIAESREDQSRIWNVRKVGLGILDSRPRSVRPVAFIEDCAIPVEMLGEFVREVERIISSQGVVGGIYAHASAGCLHIRPVLNLQSHSGVRTLRTISDEVFALTMQLGGSMSSEHGDGIARGEWVEKTYGWEVADAMRLIKGMADPDNLLNPGKLFDAPQMDTNLRFGERYQVKLWDSTLHFEHERGLAGAIEHCNGQGVCRKSTGVMCPSFQATRDEMQSTRGRANLLRSLINAQSPLGYKNSKIEDSVFSALDLCLACKGCKAECPSGVDMAKLKYEFENQYYQTHPRQLRDYVFGYFHLTARLASVAAPLSNTVMRIPILKILIAKLLGITTKRPFPKFSISRPRVERQKLNGKRIIYMSDPFARYIEPHIEQAALDVLSACGYDIQVLPILGAGASLLSKGFLDAAKRHAERVLDNLNRIDPKREATIVGIEPPEIYTLKNDYPDLLPSCSDEIASLSARTWLLDEYLLRSERVSNLRVGNSPQENDVNRNTQKIKFQPHCHQRAEGLALDELPSGTNATVKLLQLCGFDVEVLNTGCCGMAGTFGYEVEHYDLSMQVGELNLFPLLRKSAEENEYVQIVGTGAACRMQIFHGVDMIIKHPIELVWERIQLKGSENL